MLTVVSTNWEGYLYMRIDTNHPLNQSRKTKNNEYAVPVIKDATDNEHRLMNVQHNVQSNQTAQHLYRLQMELQSAQKQFTRDEIARQGIQDIRETVRRFLEDNTGNFDGLKQHIESIRSQTTFEQQRILDINAETLIHDLKNAPRALEQWSTALENDMARQNRLINKAQISMENIAAHVSGKGIDSISDAMMMIQKASTEIGTGSAGTIQNDAVLRLIGN